MMDQETAAVNARISDGYDKGFLTLSLDGVEVARWKEDASGWVCRAERRRTLIIDIKMEAFWEKSRKEARERYLARDAEKAARKAAK